MISVAIADYIVSMAEDIPDQFGPEMTLIERFGLERADSSGFFLSVQRGLDSPFLRVEQRYWPDRRAGSHPGILLVTETHVLFIGAGERLLAYDLNEPCRLWEDRADAGFHAWQRHGDIILMNAELELAAWDIRGQKLWTTFVEPPWEYRVEQDIVHLDVMGVVSSFHRHTGPSNRHS